MNVTLIQGPEGSPNFCFGVYDASGSGKGCLEFAQTDWDYAPLASRFGWVPCGCGATDGTVDCEHRKTGDMLAEAFEFLAERDGETFDIEWE